MRRAILLSLVCTLTLGVASTAQAAGGEDVMRKIALYIPNRALDLLDVFRARVRVGPTLAIGARALGNESFSGNYGTVFAGLPGARHRQLPKLPFGLESRDSVNFGPADDTLMAGPSPDYSSTEIGVDVQALAVGAAIGFDYGEAWDFLAGLVLMDPRGDDY